MKVKIKVEGLRQLDAALGDLKNKTVAKGVVRRALLESAEPMRARAEAAAPVREDTDRVVTFGPKGNKKVRRVGTMRALVQMGTRLTKRQAGQARRETKFFSAIYVGTRDRIARLREFGTVGQSAEPFMRPAFDGEGEATIGRFMAALLREIQAAAARQARKAAKLKRGE